MSEWAAFKKLPVASKIYIITFVSIMFSGATLLYRYIFYLMIIMLFILLLMALKPGRTQTAAISWHALVPFGLLACFSLFLFWQRGIAFAPEIVRTYAIRYGVYACLFIFLIRLDVAQCAVKASKYYSAICAASILFEVALVGGRAGGLLASFQSAGMMMSVGCILWLVDYYRDGGWKNIAGAFICVFALATTGKRTFSLIAIAAFLIIYLLSVRQNGKRAGLAFFAVLVSLLVLVICLYYFVPSAKLVFERFLLMEEDSYTATSGRDLLWAAAFDIFRKNPVTGIGFGGFQRFYGDYYLGSRGAAYLTHNIYYGLLAETGLIGFCLIASLFAWGLLYTLKLWREVYRDGGVSGYLAIYSLAMQLWFIVYGFTGNGIYDANEMCFYIFALVIAISIRWYPNTELAHQGDVSCSSSRFRYERGIQRQERGLKHV